jgi:dCTP deaminase
VNILSRREIIALFESRELKIESTDNYYEKSAKLSYSKDNPFQLCSLDLRVGAIYIPESDDDDLGGISQPRTVDHILDTGATVLIETKEKITLPLNVGAICFSPSRMALRGVMITNTGHVDPGYSGHLHFTAINMGKGPYGLKVNEIVCTMLLFKLSEEVEPYGKEIVEKLSTKHGVVNVSSAVSHSLPELSKDFVNVEKRARDIAEKTIENKKVLQIYVPIVSAALIAAIPLYQTMINKPWESETKKWESETQKSNIRIEVLEKKIDYDKRITDLETQIKQIKTQK